MGALTENRKRCFAFVDHPISDLKITPSSKKPKLRPQIPAPTPKAVSFPPTAPFSRQVHGPQRVIKAFNLGSSSGRGLVQREPFQMGNFASSLFESKREEGLGLEAYRKMVNDSGFREVNPGSGSKLGLGSVEEISLPPPTDAEEVKVLNRKVVDARNVVENVWVKNKKPVYLELYEQAKKRDPRLSTLSLDQKLAELKLSGLQSVPKAQEENPKEVFIPLTDEEEDEVSYAFRGGKRRQLLVTHKASNIEITGEVLQCLNGNGWLNDEVINLYLELLKERERREPKKFLKCHFFSTFFYKRLISGRNGYDYNAVKRWTTQRKLGYGLIECDKIFVPIHQDIHWCLAVISVKDETFQYLDSLGGIDTAVLRVLARYFMDEVKDKSNKQIDTSSWKHEMVDALPLQQNGWDCGMFMLKYIDFYSRGLDLCFNQEHMAYFRKRTAKEILKLRAD
ncbi:uncharacterized protein A4U43_C05F9390 [Asparagus officinalis]|uniref:Ubiquitin-like protease family profile domain-containing protein n=1 Tax=Asparagus officinalis TaxID=4686 RepID=A0A5P1EVV6_ASPOF|nr:putative ubiquitin-like-specific protease 1B [Asparagus officinalis]ONK68260.1 uncharacterized protein A4U43_C05F9390 [Asparagus officinalis]